jgi:hypothetical protein
MSFGDLPFCRRTCRDNTRNVQKYTKNIAKQTPDMSPRGEGPLTRQIKAQLGGQKRPKPISNLLQMAPNFAGPIQKPKEDNPPKLGSFGPNWGAAAPLLAPLGPIFGELADTALAMAVPQDWPRFNVPKRRFGGRFAH